MRAVGGENVTVIAASSPVVDHPVVPPQLCHDQVRHIINSEIFRNAPTLQLLLRFLAGKVLDDKALEIKEYTIGVEALSRRQDFDPKNDPIVRVQVYRLRQKLKEYYDLEGSHDSILVEIPRGHYLPRFETISPLVSGLHPVPAPDREHGFPASSPPTRTPRRLPRASWFAAATTLALLLFVAGFWTATERQRLALPAASSRPARGTVNEAVKAFWAPLLNEDSSPIIAYADAIFLLDDSSDLFRFRRGAADNRGAPVDPHLAHEFASN
ncbi:MAG: hypothetical protein ACLGXA_03545, partial [Acidobacteriota bacterium]